MPAAFASLVIYSSLSDDDSRQPIYDSDAYEFGAIKEILDIKGVLSYARYR
jgi:hypothetical protein